MENQSWRLQARLGAQRWLDARGCPQKGAGLGRLPAGRVFLMNCSKVSPVGSWITERHLSPAIPKGTGLGYHGTGWFRPSSAPCLTPCAAQAVPTGPLSSSGEKSCCLRRGQCLVGACCWSKVAPFVGLDIPQTPMHDQLQIFTWEGLLVSFRRN